MRWITVDQKAFHYSSAERSTEPHRVTGLSGYLKVQFFEVQSYCIVFGDPASQDAVNLGNLY
jgi:hypothetical protein